MSTLINGIRGRASRYGRHLPTANLSTTTAGGRSPSPLEGDWEEFDLSSTEYARRRRELMQLISDLRSMGAQAVIDIPSVVVIGGQSAGKSSLVEAVSGVHVPRDSGTCTRCPMECTMSSSATSWSCNIKLRFDYDSNGLPSDLSREVVFGSVITDRNEVDIWLRRAQAAILNPNLLPTDFYRKSIQQLRSFTSPGTLKFSRNVVSIFIEDPDATDLSFVDLPGLIQNEEREVVELVKQLTVSYIKRPNTIILTTIPMSDDMQNQLSVTLAKEADPEGMRTIGILTKPDMLGAGAINARQQWCDVIEGREHILEHGYYCVLLPDDAQRAQRLSRPELQRIAAEYFNTTSPWRDVTNRRRFGIPSFVSDISSLFVKHINRVLPELRQNVERLLDECLDKLRSLPSPLNVDPQIEVLASVNKFCEALKSVVSGTNSDKSLAQRNRALYTKFARKVRGTAPDFRPFDKPEQYQPITSFEPEEAAVTLDVDVEVMGVYEVRKTIKESIGWELPGNIPYEAKVRLIKQFTVLWFLPARACLTSINDVLDDEIQKLVKIHFGRFDALHNLILNLIQSDVEEHKNRALTVVNQTLELEVSPVFTQNENDYQSLCKRWLLTYRQARQRHTEHRITAATPNSISYNSTTCVPTERILSLEEKALYYLAQAGYTGLTVHDLPYLSARDPHFEDELTVMADVRAYFTIACKRIIDHVPLNIEHALHHALADKLSVSLLQRLLEDAASRGNSVNRMKELVSENPETGRRRTSLEAKRNRLQEMKRRLAALSA